MPAAISPRIVVPSRASWRIRYWQHGKEPVSPEFLDGNPRGWIEKRRRPQEAEVDCFVRKRQQLPLGRYVHQITTVWLRHKLRETPNKPLKNLVVRQN